MLNKKIVLSALVVLCAAIPLAAQAYKGEHFAKDAKISIEAARTIALKAYPGKIIDEELEREKGGSGLRYSFDIKKSKSAPTQEVGCSLSPAVKNSTEDSNKCCAARQGWR